ncbi:MAG: DNA repair protein RecO C-terminal domain-containing protein [Muribaculaceae bacterium]|nr:DNA repair protein RecO C-terminal domain-containing protein [Muribaculaceae bacterium]
MIEKISGIVLDVTRHSDRHNVVTLFTRSRGRISFLSGAGGGRAGRLRNSRLQLLSVIETDINFRQNAELQKLGAFSLSYIWSGIYFHPVKSMITLFISDFLNRLLRASMSDPALYDYIVNSLRLFDGMEQGAFDFHIAFLASLLPFMGIQPDSSDWHPGSYFDMRNGTFTDHRPPHVDFLQGDEARVAAQMSDIDFANISALSLDHASRRTLLDTLMRYYSIHYPGISSLPSLDILRQLK